MKRLWQIINYSSEVRFSVLTAISTTIGFKVLDLTPGLIIGFIVDLLVREKESYVATHLDSNQSTVMNLLAFAAVGAWMLSAMFQYLASLSWKRAARELQFRLRADLFKHVQCLPLSWFHNNKVGSTFDVIHGDASQIELFISRSLDEIVQVFISVLLLWVIVAFIDMRFLWCVVLPVPVLALFIGFIRNHVRQIAKETKKRMRLLSNVTHRHLMGILDVKSLAQEDFTLNEVVKANGFIKVSNQRSAKFMAALMPITKLIVICGVVAVLLYGGQMVLHGHVNAGIFTGIVFLTQRFLWPLCGIGRIVDNFSRFWTSLEHVDAIRDTPVESTDDIDERRFEFGSIRLENISFGYSNRKLFQNLNVEFPPNQISVIQGPSGVGKTTLSLCLLRLYNLQDGTIRFGNQSIEAIPLKRLRSLVGYVPQNPNLFGGTLLQNIVLDDSNPNMQRVKELMDSLGLSDLKNKLNVPLDLDSMKLSGGQIQRIAIARVLYREAKVMIFDEASSALDLSNETRLLSLLNRIKHGRIIILISHRESIGRYADAIYTFKEGDLVKEELNDGFILNTKKIASDLSADAGQV